MLKKTLEITLFASSGLMGIGVSRLSLFLLKKGGGPWYFFNSRFFTFIYPPKLVYRFVSFKGKRKVKDSLYKYGGPRYIYIYIYTYV